MKNLKSMKLFFSMAWRISPSYVILLFANSILAAARIIANVVLPKYLIDELMGSQKGSHLLFWGCTIVGTNVIFYCLTNFMKRGLDIRKNDIEKKFLCELSGKILNVEYAHLENPYYLDLKERAIFAISNQGALERLIGSFSDVVRIGVTLIGLVTIMFQLSWVLVALLVGIIAVILLIQRKFSKYQIMFFQELIPINRRYGYYINLCYDDKFQKDFRLYQMSEMLGDKISQFNEEMMEWFKILYRKMGFYMGIYEILIVLQSALAYGYVGLRCISDVFGSRISIGGLTMYVNAAINFSSSIMQLGTTMVDMSQVLVYLEPFMELMQLPNEAETGGNRQLDQKISSIRFENVSFYYPKSDVLVLNNISFEIKGGEKISIVGLNGAGKTTLVKLLCRLYRPTEGKIYINDTDIFEYELESYLKRISGVFQDFKLFNYTIEENITCQDPGTEEKKAAEILEKVGLKDKIEELPKGIHTVFGKEYDEEGIEVSGGQAQKVAIARALYKEGDLIILDEPTSALDPMAEAEIYEQFNQLVGEKTAIYISHRMSSSVFCDRVLILDGGRVADFDTHVNLMKKEDSLYYRMFNAQAVNYQL